jgi:hypothetical protein
MGSMTCSTNAPCSLLVCTLRRQPGLVNRLALLVVFAAIAAWPPRGLASAIRPAVAPARILVQGDSDNDTDQVPPAEVDRYLAVYKAMQRDRSLTAEKAAAQQGMTLQAFRELESRVERDDAATQHVRDELQKSARQALPSAPSPGTAPQK